MLGKEKEMASSENKNSRGDGRSGPADAVRFGPFRYRPDQSLLLKEGKRIGSRALSLLFDAAEVSENDRAGIGRCNASRLLGLS